MSSTTSKLAHTLYGEPATSGQRPAGDAGRSSRLAPAGAPYLGRGPKCAGNDDTCNANKMRGQDYCVGHLKGIKAAETNEVTDGD
jgi:hypothetical protein